MLAVGLLGTDPAGGPTRELAPTQLEVAVLDRNRPRRTFRRITGQLLERLLSTDDPTRDAPPADDGADDALGARRHDQPADPAPRAGRPARVNTPGGRRIFGIENEYGITCSTGGQRTLTPDEVARYLFRKVVAWGRSSNVFLTNGSRLYLDVGSHPEYATAECDSLRQVVAHDKAGERIIEGLVVDAQQRLREDGVAGDIYVFKNNTDSAGNSYGCHENYLVTRAGEFATISDTLLPFLISRQITCGAGKLVATSKGATYAVSQRADHIWEGVSSATTRSRPIINTRDEPHADAEHYRRLHVIVGDSNMSESTTMLKVGSCDLVLRMIEAGRGHARPHPREPDPRHPRDLARHHRPRAPCGWPTAGS